MPTRLLTAADAAGTALLAGRDPTDPASLRWAARVNHRRNVDDLRRQTRRNVRQPDGTYRRETRATLDVIDPTTTDGTPIGDARAVNPADRAEAVDTYRAILARLSPHQRTALTMKASGCDVATIAATIGCRPATAYVHLYRARLTARAVLASL